MIETHPVSDRASWLVMRQRDVTASAAGCLLGVHEFTTAYGLWALKTGRIVEDPEETAPMQRGRLLEPVAIQLLREQNPTWRVEQPGIYLRDPTVRLGCTPDAYAYDPARGLGNVQIKTVEPGVFARKWRREDGEVIPPEWIMVQAIIEASMSGATWAAVAPLVVGFGLDMPLIEIPIHAGIMVRVREAVAEFWAMVDEGREPDPDYGRDGSTIARMFEADEGTEADLSGDNRLPELADERDVLKAEIKERETRVGLIDTEFKAKLGPHATGTLANGRRVSWKTQHQRGYFREPASFRVLRYSKV